MKGPHSSQGGHIPQLVALSWGSWRRTWGVADEAGVTLRFCQAPSLFQSLLPDHVTGGTSLPHALTIVSAHHGLTVSGLPEAEELTL